MKMRIRSAWIELLGARNALRTEQVSFEIGFEGSVSVDRSKMRREGVVMKTSREMQSPDFAQCKKRVFKSTVASPTNSAAS